MTGARPLPITTWLRLLVDDGVILLSWLVLIGSGAYTTYVLSGHFGEQPSPYDTKQIWQGALIGAYWGWATYWGVPGCLGSLNRGMSRLLSHGFSPATVLAFFFYCGFALLVICYYPLFGGGVFHFLQRWRRAARQLSPPPMTPPAVNVTVQPPMMMQPPPAASYAALDVERRLLELTSLFQRGLITQHEYDQQRSNILRSL